MRPREAAFSAWLAFASVAVTAVLLSGGAGASSIVAYDNSVASAPATPLVTYDTSANFPPLWITTTNSFRDAATINLTSIWSSGIYADDFGNLLWTDTYGTVLIYYISTGQLSTVDSPYLTFSYAGPVVGISAVNDSSTATFVVLTEWGYVFAHPIGAGSWTNASSGWSLPLNSVAPLWTAVTSNVEGDFYRYHEGFWFVSYSGDIYFRDMTHPAKSKWVVNTNPGLDLVTAAANYPAGAAASNYENNVYAASFAGVVYVLGSSSWTVYDRSGLTATIGLTIDQPYTGDLFLLRLGNGTTVYESSTTAGSATGTFSSTGSVVFRQNTATGLGFDDYDGIFWAIETNGTIAYSFGPTPSWSIWSDNLLYEYAYPAVVSLDSSASIPLYANVTFLDSSGSVNLQTLNLTLTRGALSDLEFSLYDGTLQNPRTPAPLPSGESLGLNFTLYPNSSYDAVFNFFTTIGSSPSGNGIFVTGSLQVRVTDHFAYLPP